MTLHACATRSHILYLIVETASVHVQTSVTRHKSIKEAVVSLIASLDIAVPLNHATKIYGMPLSKLDVGNRRIPTRRLIMRIQAKL